MTDEKEMKPWEALLHKPVTKYVDIETPFGLTKFGIKIPKWAVIEKLRSDCIVIDSNSGTMNINQAEFLRKKLLACIVEHPFPQDQFAQCIDNLSPRIMGILAKEIEKEMNAEEDIAKNSNPPSKDQEE